MKNLVLNVTWGELERAVDTLYGEARGESRAGQVAVAWVIVNRACHPRWWGKTLGEVVVKPKQFSCWNRDDPNRKAILAASPGDPDLRACLRVFLDVLDGREPDPTGGADHYCVKSLTPLWAENVHPTAIIGNHKFYRLELGPNGDGR